MSRSPGKENFFVSLLANIAVPAALLSKGATLFEKVGLSVSPAVVLVIALAFPLTYFFWDYARSRRTNLISVLGFAGTLLTGGIGLFHLPPFWVAVKEAAVPFSIGVILLFSRKMVCTLLFNESVFDVPAIETAASERRSRGQIDAVLKKCARVLTASFFLSAILNYVLARIIVTTDPAADSAKFNAELGKMMALSWPVIVVPCMIFILAALWILIKGLSGATGLPVEKLFKKQ